MKYAILMYEGDSIIRWGPRPQSDPLKELIPKDSTPEMLQRKITPPIRRERIDTAEIEREARALRAAALRSAWAGFSTWIERFFETARRRRIEEYLARSESVAELEARLRKLERGGELVHI